MKHFGKLALLGAALAVSATYAHATLVTYSTTGTFSTTGTDTLSFQGMTLTFTGASGTVNSPSFSGGGTFTATGSSNDLKSVPVGEQFTLNIIQTAPGSGNGSIVGTLTGTLSVDQSQLILTFPTTPIAIGDIDYSEAFASYAITPPSVNTGAGLGVTTTELDIVPTPEPSSLMLLGTGLLSAGGMLMRRRRLTA